MLLRKEGSVILSPQDMQETLINRTITVIANEGLEKTTTKAITSGTGINEAYIYRHFSDKEDLLAKAFERLDDELVDKTLRYVSLLFTQELDRKAGCRAFFDHIWNFLLGNKEKCLAFVRYYYSPSFARRSVDNHKRRYIPLVDKIKAAFKDEADVWMILNHVLNVMLDFAVKVHNDQMPKEDNYTEHVFRVVYASIKQYFRNEEAG